MPSSSRSNMSRVASGVTSRVTPVPPTDTTVVDSADDRRVQRVADLHLVGGHHHDTVDDEPRLAKQLGDQWAAVILFAMCGAIVDDHDQRPAHQLPWLFHVYNRISGDGQRRGHFNMA